MDCGIRGRIQRMKIERGTRGFISTPIIKKTDYKKSFRIGEYFMGTFECYLTYGIEYTGKVCVCREENGSALKRCYGED